MAERTDAHASHTSSATVGREDLLGHLTSTLLSGRSVVLRGAPGSGKTHVLRELGSRLAPAQVPLHVRGADSDTGVPLSAFAGVITAYGPTPAEGLAIYTQVPGALSAAGAVVLVDDVELLDRASGVLVAQLARVGVPMIVAAATDGALPRTLVDDLDRHWERAHLTGLSADAVLELARAELGADLSAPSAALLVTRSAGNARRVVEIVRACADDARVTEAGVDLGSLTVSAGLADIVAGVLAPLDEAARQTIELLAVADDLPGDLLDVEVLDALRRRGLVSVAEGRARMADSLVCDVVLDGLGPRRRADLCAQAAGLLADSPHDAGAATLLRVRAGLAVERSALHRAAGYAVASHRNAEALELVDACGCDQDALVRGTACSALGRLAEAEVHLEAVCAGGGEQAFVALRELGVLHAVRRADASRAVERLVAGATALDDQARSLVEVDLVKWRLMAGEAVDAGGLSAEQAHVAEDVTAVGMCLIGAMLSSMDGDGATTLELVERGHAVLAREPLAGPPYAADLLNLSRYLAQAFGGGLLEAETYALDQRERASAAAHPSLGMWEYATAELAMHAGRHTEAEVFVGRAQRHLAWHDFTGLRASADALAAALRARRGDLAGAQAAAAAMGEQARTDVKVALHLARVEAEVLLAAASPDQAAECLARTAERALGEHHSHFALLALDEAMMLAPDGPVRAAVLASLEDLWGVSPLGAVLAARTRALTTEDTEALAVSAGELTRVGLPGRAIHALGVAVSVERRRGHGEAARRYDRQRALLAAGGRVQAWPERRRPTLSARELEVGMLAAKRLRSKEIAERCGLSVRTIDNHLANVYRKLGVSGRDELVEELRALIE